MPSRQIVSRELAELLKLLAHPDRLRMIEELRLGEKDVTGIATALALSSAALEQQIGWVEKPIQLQRDMDWARNVVQPYINPAREQPLTAAWKSSFATLIKQAPTVQLLVDAKAAGEKMEAGWRDVLRGDYSLVEVRKSLADIQAALDVLVAVKAAK